MKATFAIGLLAVFATAQGLAHAQSASDKPTKPIVQTSCTDYLEMDEVVKPKFIYYSVGYSKRGMPSSGNVAIVDVDKMKPVVDEYCRVHLTSSAFQKVMEESIASEKTNR